MPLYLLPSTRDEDELVAYLMQDRQEPCGLCKRETRKTHYGRMCWECQEARPIWEAHVVAISQADYARRAAAYTGMCKSCALNRVSGDFECEPCRVEWGV